MCTASYIPFKHAIIYKSPFRYGFLNIVFCFFHKHVLSIWHIYCYLYFYSQMLYFYYINLFLLSKGSALCQLSLSVLLQPWCESVPIPFNSLCPTCKDRQPPPTLPVSQSQTLNQCHSFYWWYLSFIFCFALQNLSVWGFYTLVICWFLFTHISSTVLWSTGLVFHSTDCSLTYQIQS